MTRSDRLRELIGLAYDAALGPESWPACLSALGDALHAPAIGFFHILPGTMVSHPGICVGHDPDFLASYEQHFGSPQINPYAQGVTPELLRPGTVILPTQLCPDSELRRTEYYHGWLWPQGIGAGAFAILGSPQAQVALSIARRPSLGHLDPAELGLLHAVVPHLQRAIDVGALLEHLDGVRLLGEATLDLLAVGVFLVDARGRPTLLNRRATTLLEAGDGLGIDDGGLRAAAADANSALRRLVAAAAATTLGQGTSAGGVLRLARPSGRRPLAALVTPVARGRWGERGSDTAVAVLVNDPDDVSAPPVHVIRDLWGLTRAEAELAALLAGGRSLTEAAQTLGIATETARSQLGRIFAKTGCGRQAELVRVLTTTVPRLRAS